MKCQCPLAGYCETHGRRMSERQHSQCSSDDRFFDLFHRGPKPPSLATRAKSIVTSARRATQAAVSRQQTVTPADELAARKAACVECAAQVKKLGVDWCGVCGCALAAKQRLATETCPLGRWPTVPPSA